jgi:hypothetical protein
MTLLYILVCFILIVIIIWNNTNNLVTESFACPKKEATTCTQKKTTCPVTNKTTVVRTKCCKKKYCPACPKCPPTCPRMCPDLSKYVLKSSIPPCRQCPAVQEHNPDYMLRVECDCPNIDDYILKSNVPQTPDLSKYILRTDVPDLSECVRQKEKKNRDAYVLKSNLPDMNNYVLKTNMQPSAFAPTTTTSCAANLPTPIIDERNGTGAAFPFPSLTGNGIATPADGSNTTISNTQLNTAFQVPNNTPLNTTTTLQMPHK